MFRRLVPCLETSAAALAALLVVTAPAAAQPQGRPGGVSFGYSPLSGFPAGYNNSPYYGGNYTPRYYPGGYRANYPQYYGSQYTPDTYPGGYRANYPQYYGSQYTPDDNNNYSNVPSTSATEDGRMSRYSAEDQNVARFNVRVSPSAQIWFDGAKTTQTGGLRQFSSPPLNSDREYSYEIRARWMEGGQDIERTQKVSFHSGDRLTVNFMTRQLQGADVNGKRETLTQRTPAYEESAQRVAHDQDLRRLPSTPTDFRPSQSNQDGTAPAIRDQDARQSSVLAANTVDETTHEGKVVSITEDKLVMTGTNDQEHTHALTADVKLTCDGKVCKCEDVKAGMKIRVTQKNDANKTVTKIDTLDKNADFEMRDK